MSFRGGNRNLGRVVTPSQIFKKRNELINLDVPINSNATLLASISLQETGTVYAIILSVLAFQEAGASADVQRVTLWVRCVPADTALPDLTDTQELDTINGFSPKTLHTISTNGIGDLGALHQKFRFRRKCDSNMQVELIAQHTNTQGTGRVVNMTGLMTVVLRVR